MDEWLCVCFGCSSSLSRRFGLAEPTTDKSRLAGRDVAVSGRISSDVVVVGSVRRLCAQTRL